MKRKDFVVLAVVGVITAAFSIVLASVLFPPKKLSEKVPLVDKISPTFPDIVHEPSYHAFLNEKSNDLTQPVQIGNNQNQEPFTQTSP